MTPAGSALFYDLVTYDTIIRNGRWFDGTGAPSAVRNIGIRDGHVVAIYADDLDETGCPQVIDATGKWVLPGMLDIHTHYDVEVLDGPALSESLRHGVTTVMLGSCSLSTIHVDGVDAGDLFGRVEAIPREHVIGAVDEHKTWTTAEEYVEALEALPLGPNLAAFIGHSDMRAADHGPGPRHPQGANGRPGASRPQMERMLAEALRGRLRRNVVAAAAFRQARRRGLPLAHPAVDLRQAARAAPAASRCCARAAGCCSPGPTSRTRSTSARRWRSRSASFRNPLKTSLLSAADVKANPYAVRLMGPLARLVNRLGGNFRWQHLPVPFEVYADGIDLVIFEEFGAGAAALHLRDEVERNELMRDEAYRREFRKDYESKFGVRVWHRDFFDAEIVDCPDASVIGKSFGQVGLDRGGLHPVDAFLDLVLEHGTALRWRTTISNHRPEVLKKLARDPGIQMGFSDAGAHLRNMAFYNMGLRLLRHVQRRREGRQAVHDHRAGRAPADRRTGRLVPHRRRPPAHRRPRRRRRSSTPRGSTRRWTTTPRTRSSSTAACPGWSTATTTPSPRCSSAAARCSSTARPTELVGKQRTGRFLRAAHKAPAVTAQEGELASVG